jgi:hypothetical protein
VTRANALAALPPEVAERVNRDCVVRLAETPGRVGARCAARAHRPAADGEDPGDLPDGTAAETIETQTAIGMLALENIDAVLAGRTAPSLVSV